MPILPRTKAVDRLLVRRQGSGPSSSSSSSSSGQLPSTTYDPRRPFFTHSFSASPPSSPTAKAKARWTRAAATRPPRRFVVLLICVVAGAVAWYCFVLRPRWSAWEQRPRKKLDYRWWEVDEPPQEDLSALLPKPTISLPPPLPPPPRPPSADAAEQNRLDSHTYDQLLRLPSTFPSASPPVTWTAVVHLYTPASTTSARLGPLLSALTDQAPAGPARILLLLPRTIRPPSESILTPYNTDGVSNTVQLVSYSHTRGQSANERDFAALLGVIRAASTGDIDSDYLVFVDGSQEQASHHFVKGDRADVGGRGYVADLLHASGTKEYRAALLSAGGLAFEHLPLSHDDHSDTCAFPSRRGGDHPRTAPDLTARSQRISIPTTPFLLPVSWLVPRDPTDPTHTSVVQGLSPASSGLNGGTEDGVDGSGVAGILAAALWTKHAIPAFALPLTSDPSSGASSKKGPMAAVDGGACERLRAALRRDENLAPSSSSRSSSSTGGNTLRDLFAPHLGAGEGLRLSRASGDRARGGLPFATPGSDAETENSPLERAEELKSEIMQTGTAVLLVSGEHELDAVRKLACRFAAQGVGQRGSVREEEDESTGFDSARSGRDPRRDRRRVKRDLKVVVADLDLASRIEPPDSATSCHLDLTPLRGGTLTSGTDGAAISVPLLELLDSLNPAPAFVLYLTDSPRAREFEEVLRWQRGYFGPKQGQDRLGRVRAERAMLRGGEGGRIRPTVVAMSRDEVKRAEWIGALSLEALRHFHTPRIDVSVVTNDRPVSLHRLLSSLRTAHYFGDDVALTVNLEQTADRLTHRLVDDLSWPHGSLALRHRILLGGLMPAIVESWYPASNDTYGVLLEDDVEVSPLFYGWLKFAILHYRYTLAGRRASSRLFGISLYQQKNIELRPEGRQPFDAHALFRDLSLPGTTPYLSQIPCSWGAAYFPEQWREFHTYLALRLSELALPISEPIVPAIRSNRWPRSWKKYFIELVYLRGYTMLYPNYPDFASLSTNHLEVGTHVHTAVELKKKVLFEVPLLARDASLVDSLPGPPGHEHLPGWESLPVVDLWGSLASSEELLERGWQTTRMIGSCGPQQLPSLEPRHLARPRYDAHELLCRRAWDRELEERLVDAQPLQPVRVRTPHDEEAESDGQPNDPADSPAEPIEGEAAPADGDRWTETDWRRTDAEPLAGPAADSDHNEDIPTVERLDILPTEGAGVDEAEQAAEDEAVR